MSATFPGEPSPDLAPVVLDRREGPYGEVVLRRHGELLQIIANGCFLMDTSDGRSERLLVDHALNALDDRPRPSVLIGGLGVGFSLAHAAADPRPGRITVVEREQAIINWHGRQGRQDRQDRHGDTDPAPFAKISADALADPRTRVLHTDLVAYLRAALDGPAGERTGSDDDVTPPRTGPADGGAIERYDALCLDIDNGPDWTVTEDNDTLYSPAGLAACRARLTPGGVLAVWSAQPSSAFEGSLQNAGFQRVRTEEIPVARGVPDVVHLAVGPG